jgi:hypothetical protein
MTRSTSQAAVSAIRRPPQEEQKPRPLQLKVRHEAKEGPMT